MPEASSAQFQGEVSCIPVAFRKLPRASQLNSICPLCTLQLWCPPSFPLPPFFFLFFLLFLSFIQRMEWLLPGRPQEALGISWFVSDWELCSRFAVWIQLPGFPVCFVSLIKLKGLQARAAPPHSDWGSPEQTLCVLLRRPPPGQGGRRTCPSLQQRCAWTSLSGVNMPTSAQIPNF